MSAQVHSVNVYAPSSPINPRIVEAVEILIDYAIRAVVVLRQRRAAARAERQLQRDVRTARREAYAWMRDDPRMGADLLAAIDRHEAMFLSEGSIAR